MKNEIVEDVTGATELPTSDELMATLQDMVACASSQNSDAFTALMAVAWD